MKSHAALIIVDVQNDFCEGGALAVKGGTEVASRISDYVEMRHNWGDLVIASKDWHNPLPDTNSGHFDEWPVHCVADTEGAQYHQNLQLPNDTVHIKKGVGTPDYSVFQGVANDGRTLNQLLEDFDIDEVFVVGLALDYCVKSTAIDAANYGYAVTVPVRLTAGVDAHTTLEALHEMHNADVYISL